MKADTHTLENIDKMVGCFPAFLVTRPLAGDDSTVRRRNTVVIQIIQTSM